MSTTVPVPFADGLQGKEINTEQDISRQFHCKDLKIINKL